LCNRRIIIEHLESQLFLAKINKLGVELVYRGYQFFQADQRRFQQHAGDTVLRKISSSLHALMRQRESLGRYDGVEFLFVLFLCVDVFNRYEKYQSAVTQDKPVSFSLAGWFAPQ
jgi:PleD family two-component response regulator